MGRENRAMEVKHLNQSHRANIRAKMRANEAVELSSSHPHGQQQETCWFDNHKAKVTQKQANLTVEKGTCAGSRLQDRRTRGERGIGIHEEHVQFPAPT